MGAMNNPELPSTVLVELERARDDSPAYGAGGRVKRAEWIVAAALLQAAPVFGQTTDGAKATTTATAAKPSEAAKPSKAPSKTDKPPEQSVTVTGKALTYQSSIDRRSYSVANDLQRASGGSIADVLRNVPSVDVDVQGNVSLRGSTSVTILIDGHPSALMSGQNRADVLQQMPADQIERVEVMTNPSAAFKPDGTAGIINLVTKKSAKNAPKVTGSIRANVGTGDRYNVSASETLSLKDLSLSGNVGYRRSNGSIDGSSTTQLIDPTTGAVSHSQSNSSGVSHNLSSSAHGGFDYDLNTQTRLSGELSFFSSKFNSDSTGAYSSDATSGLSSKNYNFTSGYAGRFGDVGGAVTFLRKLGGDEHEFSVRLSRDSYINHFNSTNQFNYLDPAQSNLYQALRSNEDQSSTELKAEYKGPLSGAAKLVAGYEFSFERENGDHQGALGTAVDTAVVASALTSYLKADQGVHALYATYQRPFGSLTVMPGLRLEEAVIHLNQLTSQIKAEQDYFRVYPTLHLAYKIDENQRITASYSQRVQRPSLDNLNPYRVYNSPLSYSQGNAKLEPQTTDSYELGYEFRYKTTYYLATLYYRDNRKQFTQIQQDIGGGVLLNTQANLGHSRNTGLELVANGELLKNLTYSLSGNLYWNEIDPGGLALATAQSAVTESGKGSLSWNPTPKDFFQFNINGRGKTPTGQGYSGAFVTMNLGYRHKFDDKLAFVTTLVDPFDQYRFDSFIDTPALKEQSRYRFHQRALYLGLTYALGTGKARLNEGFDSGGGGGGPGH